MNSQPNSLLGFAPITVLSLALAFVLYFLGKGKGRNDLAD
jgi:hypothetical protein